MDEARVVRQGQLVIHFGAAPGQSAEQAAGALRLPGDLVALDLVLEPHQAFQQRLRTRRATGHVNVDRHHQVDALDHVVAVLEIRPAAHRAGAHGDHVLRVGHHVVEPADPAGHLVGHRAGHDHQVGLPRRGAERAGPESVHVEAAGAAGHHLDGTAGQAEGHRPEARLPGPVDRLLERGDITFSSNRPSIHGCVMSYSDLRRVGFSPPPQSSVLPRPRCAAVH